METEIKVALFEDNYMLRDGYYQLINGTPGFKCVGAFDSANDVVFKINSSRPDVVLMDIDMPGTDGISATRMIKEHFPQIHIVIQTVFEDEEKIFESIHSGSNGYILKKSPPLKILEAITDVYNGGAPMTPSIASKTLRLFRQGTAAPSVDKTGSLNERQKEILECIVNGMSYKLIAEKLFISVETVKYHVKNIYSTLHVHSRIELMARRVK
jgi:DNA-binding NarL/FixJ family response regulator